MKVLLTVEYYYPSVGGAQEVVKQISERLFKRGHDVTVATTKLAHRTFTKYNGVKIKEFDIDGNDVRGYRGDIQSYQNYLLNGKFDIVLNYAAQQWTSDLCSQVMEKITAKTVLVPCGFSGLNNPGYCHYFASMPSVLKKYDATVYMSQNYRDYNFAKKHHIHNIHFIPNAASKEEFAVTSDIDIRKLLKIPKDNFLILHVGSHTRVKGHKELFQIFSKSKINNATLLLIANNSNGGCTKNCHLREFLFNFNILNKFKNKKVNVTPLNRAQTIAAYQQSDLFLFPSNIECSPLVLFEAMASKTPFLTSDVGNSSEIAQWSGSGIVLPTIKRYDNYHTVDIAKSADKLLEIYVNEKKRLQMAEMGYKAWLKDFTWDTIVDKYESLFEKLLSQDHKSQTAD